MLKNVQMMYLLFLFFFLLGKRNVNLEAVHDVFYNCLQKIALKLGSLKQH